MYPKRVSRVRISLSPQRYDSQPAATAAGCFCHTADASALVDAVWRKQTIGPLGPTAVSQRFARTPREGTRCRKRSAAESRPRPHRTSVRIGPIDGPVQAKTALNAGMGPTYGPIQVLCVGISNRHLQAFFPAIPSHRCRTKFGLSTFKSPTNHISDPAEIRL